MLGEFKTESECSSIVEIKKEIKDLRSGRDQKISLDLKSFLDPTRTIVKEIKKSKLKKEQKMKQ